MEKVSSTPRQLNKAARIWILAKFQLRAMVNWPHLSYSVFVDPLLYLVLFAVGIATVAHTIRFRGVEMTYIEFFIPGLLAVQGIRFFSRAIFDSSNDVKWGIYRLIVLTGCTPIEYVLSRLVSGAIVFSIHGALLITVGSLFIGKTLDVLARIPAMLIIACLGLIFWLSLGMILGVRIDSYAKRDFLASIVTLPVMFSSSAFYSIESAPFYLKALAMINPLTYHADALRLAFIGQQVSFSLEIIALGSLGGVSLLFCGWVLKKAVLARGER